MEDTVNVPSTNVKKNISFAIHANAKGTWPKIYSKADNEGVLRRCSRQKIVVFLEKCSIKRKLLKKNVSFWQNEVFQETNDYKKNYYKKCDLLIKLVRLFFPKIFYVNDPNIGQAYFVEKYYYLLCQFLLLTTFYRKVAFLMYTEMVNFRPQRWKAASKSKPRRGLGTRLPSSW